MFAACTTGSFYGFGVYAGAMQKALGLTDAELANVNTLPFALGFVTPPLVGRVGSVCGPSVCLVMGGVIASASQVLMFLIAAGYLQPKSLAPSVSLVLCAMGTYMGNSLVSGTAFSTPVYHFQRRRGRAISLIKTFVGLSGAVVSQLYVLLYGVPTREPGALRCLLIWAAVSGGCTLFGAAIIPSRPQPGSTEPARMLRHCFVLMLALAAGATAASLTPQEGVPHSTLVILVLALSLGPIPLALGPVLRDALASAFDSSKENSAAADPLIPPERPYTSCQAPGDTAGGAARAPGDTGGGAARRPSNAGLTGRGSALAPAATGGGKSGGAGGGQAEGVPREESLLVMETSGQLNLPQMLRTMDAWMLWFAGMALMGAGEYTEGGCRWRLEVVGGAAESSMHAANERCFPRPSCCRELYACGAAPPALVTHFSSYPSMLTCLPTHNSPLPFCKQLCHYKCRAVGSRLRCPLRPRAPPHPLRSSSPYVPCCGTPPSLSPHRQVISSLQTSAS
jgi:hypothetical protein